MVRGRQRRGDAQGPSVKADAKLYLRIDAPNIGSDWPLAGKFGAHMGDVPRDRRRGRECTAPTSPASPSTSARSAATRRTGASAWRRRASALRPRCAQAGLKPRLLNIGGGYPGAPREADPVDRDDRARWSTKALRHSRPEVQVIAEPGRYLVSDAGYFVCRVVGTATRDGKRWMYWDAGLFGGVIETTEGLQATTSTPTAPARTSPGPSAGPTCDSVDVVMRDEPLPVRPAGRRLHLSSRTPAPTPPPTRATSTASRCPKCGCLNRKKAEGEARVQAGS